MQKHFNQNKIYLKFVRKQLSAKTRTIMEYQLTAFYTAPKAISKTTGNFKIFIKSKINYPCN